MNRYTDLDRSTRHIIKTVLENEGNDRFINVYKILKHVEDNGIKYALNKVSTEMPSKVEALAKEVL